MAKMIIKRHPNLVFEIAGDEHCLLCQRVLGLCGCLPLTILNVSAIIENAFKLEARLHAVKKVMKNDMRHTDEDCIVCKLLVAVGDREPPR